VADEIQFTEFSADPGYLVVVDIPHHHQVVAVAQGVVVRNHADTADGTVVQHCLDVPHKGVFPDIQVVGEVAVGIAADWQALLKGQHDKPA
jgi:hypothetical protein